ncbi:DUF6245 family protein [Streptomyces sp. NPDC087218]|uniref:DUF6245 family protein n=1 Tax=Streptomyces sp. NPDC087218 TaxID=3365769 RepID=UPI0038016895
MSAVMRRGPPPRTGRARTGSRQAPGRPAARHSDGGGRRGPLSRRGRRRTRHGSFCGALPRGVSRVQINTNTPGGIYVLGETCATPEGADGMRRRSDHGRLVRGQGGAARPHAHEPAARPHRGRAPRRRDRVRPPAKVERVAAAMAALGSYGGEGAAEGRAGETVRLGGPDAYRVRMANALLGAVGPNWGCPTSPRTASPRSAPASWLDRRARPTP